MRMQAHQKTNEGKMIIFTAPSGAGKTTIVRHLLDRFPQQLDFSVSATTRERRPHEIDGVHYHFLDLDSFKEKIHNGEFAEWEEVYENQFYGTLKSEIERLWKKGKTILFDIDVRGAVRLKKLYGDKAYVVFVAPPSIKSLEERLSNRKTETKSSLLKRIKRAIRELEYREKFDRVLINDDLEDALEEARQIVADFVNIESTKMN